MNPVNPAILVNLTGCDVCARLLDGQSIVLPRWEGVHAHFLPIVQAACQQPLRVECGPLQCVEPPVENTILIGFPAGMEGRYAVVAPDVAKHIIAINSQRSVGICSCDGTEAAPAPLTVWRWI